MVLCRINRGAGTSDDPTPDAFESDSAGQGPSRRRGALARIWRALESQTKLRLKLTAQVRFSVDRTEGGVSDR